MILGVGSFGMVVSHKGSNRATKLFYDLHAPVGEEAALQQKARTLLEGIPHLSVPAIHNIQQLPTEFQGSRYLCGIEMDRVPIPEGFQHPVHMLLGYGQDDIDTVWSKDYRNPVGPNNPPRGFFAGPEMLEAIWADEGSTMTIERVAAIMGTALAKLIAGGIIPLDLEWLYAGDDQLYLIDFGLCEFGSTNPHNFLHMPSSRGIYADYYAPKPDCCGYTEFLGGWNSIIPVH